MSGDLRDDPDDDEPGFDSLDLSDVTPAEDIAQAIAAAHAEAVKPARPEPEPMPSASELVSRYRAARRPVAWTADSLVDPGELWPAAEPAPAPAAEPAPASPASPAPASPASPEPPPFEPAAASPPPPPPLPASPDAASAPPSSYDVEPPTRPRSVEAELSQRLRRPTLQGPPRGVPFDERATLGLPDATLTQRLAEAGRAEQAGSQRGPHAPVEGLPGDRGPLPPAPDVALEPRAPGSTAQPTAKVRSQRLHHVRSASAPARKVQPEPASPATRRPRADTDAGPWYRRMLILVMLVLLDAALLPDLRDGVLVAPWRALASPGSPTFIATTFLVVLSLLAFVPAPMRARATIGALLGLVLSAFGAALLVGAVGAGAFDGQPALAHIIGAGAPARWVLVLAVSTLTAALFWRRHHPDGLGARVLLGTGLLFVGFIYFAGHRIGLADTMPLTALVHAARGAPFVGDRAAAWLALVPLALAPAALLCLSELGRRGASVLGALFWASVAAPLVVLAAFVAPASQWAQTLAPLQVSAVLAAGLLLLPAGLGALLTSALADDP
ncbi:MAG: hypothetical protein H6744_15565 [Deltaproteobacteria bacterium]|nr:hypothetical protein [Deltaproteobacteria bacterium]